MLINGIDLSGLVRGLWLTDRPWPFRRDRVLPPRPCFELRARKRPRKTRLSPYLPPYFLHNYLGIKEMLRSDPEIMTPAIRENSAIKMRRDRICPLILRTTTYFFGYEGFKPKLSSRARIAESALLEQLVRASSTESIYGCG